MIPYWRLPGLGIIVYLLKQSANDFFSYYDSHRQNVSKLQNVEQLPPEEIKEVTFLYPSLAFAISAKFIL